MGYHAPHQWMLKHGSIRMWLVMLSQVEKLSVFFNGFLWNMMPHWCVYLDKYQCWLIYCRSFYESIERAVCKWMIPFTWWLISPLYWTYTPTVTLSSVIYPRLTACMVWLIHLVQQNVFCVSACRHCCLCYRPVAKIRPKDQRPVWRTRISICVLHRWDYLSPWAGTLLSIFYAKFK